MQHFEHDLAELRRDSSSRCCAAAASASGNVAIDDRLQLAAKKNRAARSSSPFVPMYEPMIESCLRTARAGRARRRAGRGAAGHQPAAARQRADALRPGRLADMFYDDIDAAPVRQPLDFRRRCPACGGGCTSVAPSARARSSLSSDPAVANTRAPCSARNLDRRLADAAAGGEHQDVLAALQPRARHQHVPGGQERQRKRRGLDEVDLVGNRDQVLQPAP